MRSKSNSTRSKLERKADALLKECAFLLFSNKCAICRRPSDDPHHIEERSDKSLRWHIMNVLPLCRYCHDKSHNKQEEFLEWLVENLPEYYAFHIENRNSKPKPIMLHELHDTIEELKALKNHLETNDPRRYTKWKT